MGALEI